MNTITVNASTAYDVVIGSNILDAAGSYVRSVSNAEKAAIISDSNVFPIYGERVRTSLEQLGFSVSVYLFPAGEASKNAGTYLSILQFLADFGMTRSDIVVALGGGVTGDMAGFAAATYMRGVDFVQIPTSLLAMVDSSVGGKTAIDLPGGKNLVGAFHQPRLVLCDCSALDTLPREYLLDGCGEIMKYGLLGDRELLLQLRRQGTEFDRECVISRCVDRKRDIVERDEFEGGLRQLLNLGHTLGHAVEACSNFSISHGSAVAMGLAIFTRAAAARGLCPGEDAEIILDAIHTLGLPDKTVISASDLCDAMLADKKRSGSAITCIIPHGIGDCRRIKLDLPQLKEFTEAGM